MKPFIADIEVPKLLELSNCCSVMEIKTYFSFKLFFFVPESKL